MRSTILSENQYEKKFMPSATTSASIMPCDPPIIPPITMKRAVIAAISIAVLNRLNIEVSGVDEGPRQMRPRPTVQSPSGRERRSAGPIGLATEERPAGLEPPAAGALQLGEAQRRGPAGDRDACVASTASISPGRPCPVDDVPRQHLIVSPPSVPLRPETGRMHACRRSIVAAGWRQSIGGLGLARSCAA